MAAIPIGRGFDRNTATPNPGVRYTSGNRVPLGLGKDGQPFRVEFAGSAPPPSVTPLVVMTIVT